MRPSDKSFEDLHDFEDRALPKIKVDVVASVDGLEDIVQEGKVKFVELVDDDGVRYLESFVVHHRLSQLAEVSV